MGAEGEAGKQRGVSVTLREMDELAAQARQAMETFRARRKFDLTTRSGWLNLHEATFAQSFAGDAPADAMARLRRMSIRWRQLYRVLCFHAATRPVWNS